MKPRTKTERTVAELSQKLPPLTQRQELWAYDHCFKKKGYLCKGTVWCLHCGAEFKYDGASGTAVCPDCGKTIKIEKSRKGKDYEKWYYTVIDTAGGFQVCRHFIVHRNCIRGKKTSYHAVEVVQNWISENGKETIIARPCSLSFYNDSWIYTNPMEIRRPYGYYNNGYAKYVIDAYFVYPVRRILPVLKRNGYTARAKGVAASTMFKRLLTDNMAETLIKTRQFSLLKHYLNNGIYRYEYAVHIAVRHGYIVKDAPMWLDYIYLLSYFGKDTHNPKYLFPDNLRKEHDRLMKKKQDIEEKRRMEQEKRRMEQLAAEAASWQDIYVKDKGKFFGIELNQDGIRISALRSVSDFEEEGKAMHHCVYVNRYFKKENSLILSARNTRGERLETVELNLKTFKVVQSYGACNKITEYHDRIIHLVESNSKMFSKIMNAS